MKVFSLILVLHILGYIHSCGHDEIQRKTKIYHTPLKNRYCRFRKRCDSSRRFKQDDALNPLTIKLGAVYKSGIPYEIFNKATQYPLQIVAEVTNYISQIVKVKAEPELDLSYLKDVDFNCGGMSVNDPNTAKVYTGNFVLMILRTDKYRKHEDISFGAVCGRDTNHQGRPIMAYLYMNFDYFNVNKETHGQNVAKVLHSIIHLLGFSSSSLDYFLDDSGKPIGKDKVVKTKENVRGIEKVMMLDIPRLTTFARKYFKCDSLEGVEIEEHTQNFVDFLPGSHFQSRIVRDDIMSVNNHKVNQLSQFTVYVLESTGWYEFDRDVIGISLAGRGSGCEYINQKCVKSYNAKTNKAQVVSELDFCSNIGQYYHCNDRFTGGGYCGSKGKPKEPDYTVIEKPYDYFNGLQMTGGIDNCPIIQSQNSCWDISRRIKNEEYFQYTGSDSRCFTGNYNYEGVTNEDRGYCLNATCKMEEGEKVININIDFGVNVQCRKGDKQIDLSDKVNHAKKKIVGKINCPDIDRFCVATEMQYFKRKFNPNAVKLNYPYLDKKKKVFSVIDMPGPPKRQGEPAPKEKPQQDQQPTPQQDQQPTPQQDQQPTLQQDQQPTLQQDQQTLPQNEDDEQEEQLPIESNQRMIDNTKQKGKKQKGNKNSKANKTSKKNKSSSKKLIQNKQKRLRRRKNLRGSLRKYSKRYLRGHSRRRRKY